MKTEPPHVSLTEAVAAFITTGIAYHYIASDLAHGESQTAIGLLAWAVGWTVVIWAKGLWQLYVKARAFLGRRAVRRGLWR